MTFSSEADFLRLIDSHFPNPSPGKLDSLDTVQLGRGDDCAILHFEQNTCLSSDIFMEDVHFRHSYFSPEDIGHKALAVNVSDVAAMGCVPRAFALDLMIPTGLTRTFWDRLFTGMATLANEHGLILAGGDLSRSPVLGFSIHIWGTPGPSGRILTRGNATPGDLLAVVGELGLARTGLEQLEKKGVAAKSNYPRATAQHLRPIPRVKDGLALAAIPGVRGLMDISDGLARDLPRFLAASQSTGGIGANINLAADQINVEVHQFARDNGGAADMLAMLGGEDYGLLTAIAPDVLSNAKANIRNLNVIGVVTRAPGILFNGTPFKASGFDHFGD